MSLESQRDVEASFYFEMDQGVRMIIITRKFLKDPDGSFHDGCRLFYQSWNCRWPEIVDWVKSVEDGPTVPKRWRTIWKGMSNLRHQFVTWVLKLFSCVTFDSLTIVFFFCFFAFFLSLSFTMEVETALTFPRNESIFLGSRILDGDVRRPSHFHVVAEKYSLISHLEGDLMKRHSSRSRSATGTCRSTVRNPSAILKESFDWCVTHFLHIALELLALYQWNVLDALKVLSVKDPLRIPINPADPCVWWIR